MIKKGYDESERESLVILDECTLISQMLKSHSKICNRVKLARVKNHETWHFKQNTNVETIDD
jgi:hypothetical protein